jgi:predicted transcriptional regulator of viral defense system
VNSESGRPNARGYVSGLAASGRYDFTSREAQAALSVSAAAAKLALNRLAKQKLIASPARGFYVILAPEYGALGCLPADQFIPALMKRLNLSYYAGPLSAAQYHGAATRSRRSMIGGVCSSSKHQASATELSTTKLTGVLH